MGRVYRSYYTKKGEYETDDNGRPVLDENGRPKPRRVYTKVWHIEYATTPFNVHSESLV